MCTFLLENVGHQDSRACMYCLILQQQQHQHVGLHHRPSPHNSITWFCLVHLKPSTPICTENNLGSCWATTGSKTKSRCREWSICLKRVMINTWVVLMDSQHYQRWNIIIPWEAAYKLLPGANKDTYFASLTKPELYAKLSRIKIDTVRHTGFWNTVYTIFAYLKCEHKL